MRNQIHHEILEAPFDAPLEDDSKNTLIKAKPFVKWVGGKRSALEHLKTRLPADYLNYYECFLGGGSLFFAMQPQKAFLSDVNTRLIETYKSIKEDVSKVIKELKKHSDKNSKEYFLKCRKNFNKETISPFAFLIKPACPPLL